MSLWQGVCLFLAAYWFIIWLWMKGTDPLAHDAWHWIWLLVKIVLTGGVGLILLALYYGGDE
jgi:hypothetical protein